MGVKRQSTVFTSPRQARNTSTGKDHSSSQGSQSTMSSAAHNNASESTSSFPCESSSQNSGQRSFRGGALPSPRQGSLPAKFGRKGFGQSLRLPIPKASAPDNDDWRCCTPRSDSETESSSLRDTLVDFVSHSPRSEGTRTPRRHTELPRRRRSLQDLRASLELSTALTSSQLLGFSKISVGRFEVAFVPFGYSWSLDVFALLHNAARLEILDLQTVLEGVAGLLELDGGISYKVLRLVFSWWDRFVVFILTVMDVNERLILPTLETVVPTEGAISKDSRSNLRREIRRHIKRVERRRERHSAETMLFDVTKEMETVVRRTLRYFAVLEENAPVQFETFYTSETRNELFVQTREHIVRSKEAAQVALPVVHRWLRSIGGKHYDEWAGIALPGALRATSNLWVAEMKLSHFRIPAKITAAVTGRRRQLGVDAGDT